MAATVSSGAWSKPGAWALDSEEHESELLQDSLTGSHHSSGGVDTSSDFPSLSTAASTKTKKKKPQTLSLQQFTTYGSSNPTRPESKGLTTEDLMNLPTGPRERTAEELDRSRLGGGFKSYGSGSSRVSSDETRRQGGFGRDSSREFAPTSRADDVDDWAKSKTPTLGNGFDRGERGWFFSDSQSRADESENWGSNKISVPEARRFGGSSGGVNSENWGKNKKEEEGRRFGATSGAFDSLRERRGGQEMGESENWGRRREEGSEGPRPRLNLQPRTLPVVEGPQGLKPKGSNPFGEARPREEVLKGKGKDWKEIDEKLENMKMRDVGLADGSNRGFGSGGNARVVGVMEDRSERSWRKNDSGDVRPWSAEKSENGLAEDSDPRM